MEKAEETRRSSSEDAHSPSNAEKQVEEAAPVAVLDIPDPDEGLSEAERKAIVS